MTSTAKAKASIGAVTAKFTGSHNHHFKADPNRQHIYKAAGHWHINAVQLQSSDPHQNFYGLSVKLPSSLVEDGKQRTYTFPGKASGHVYAPLNAGISVFDIIEGEITVSVKDETMSATFHLSATWGTHPMEVTQGDLKLQGISYPTTQSGIFETTFIDSPFPNKQFNAERVEIQSLEHPFEPDKWQIYGEQRIDSLPPAITRLSIQIDKDLTAKEYDLKDNSKVRIFCSSLPIINTHLATSGILHFDSLPGTGHAKGTFKCEFAEKGVKPFTATGTFDLAGPIHHSKKHT